MKTWIAAFAIASAVGAASAFDAASAQYEPAQRIARFTERDDGRTVRLPVGAELTVRLPEHGGTAYEWQWKDDYRITEIGDPVTQDVSPGLPGGTVLRTFHFQVTGGGPVPLVFRLRSAFKAKDRPDAGQVKITIDGIGTNFVPLTDGGDAQIVGENDDRFVVTKLGRPIEIHLPADPRSGYSWQVLSSRNIALEGPVGIQRKPGIFGLGGGDQTTIRLHTTVARSDGFLTLVYVGPGERPSYSASRKLDYQFTNQK